MMNLSLMIGGKGLQNRFRVLVINPKSTSTIVTLFQNELCIFTQTVHHTTKFKTVASNIDDEIRLRKEAILTLLKEAGINISNVHAISAIGGLVRSVPGGSYEITEQMLQDLRNNYNGKHVSNLGGLIAYSIAQGLNIPAYIIDPPVVDELNELARFSGLPGIERKSIFHALNQKYVARKAANELDKAYDEVNLIVAHIGHGITIGAHKQGKVIDVNNGVHGDGPFSLERAGTIPSEGLIKLCFSNEYTEEELIHEITFNGGLKAFLHTEHIEEIEQMITNGNELAIKMIEVMAYQIAKEMGAMATVLSGHVDGVVLTGELAKSKPLTEQIMHRVAWIADIFIYAGEYDVQALNEATLRVLRQEEAPKQYSLKVIKKEQITR